MNNVIIRHVICVIDVGILSITGKTWNFSKSPVNWKYWKYAHEAKQYMQDNRVKEYYPLAYVTEVKL